MTKQSRQSSSARPPSGTVLPFGFDAFNGPLAESYAKAGQMFVENAVNMNQEIVRFAGARLQNDLETVQSMMVCANLKDVIAVQTGFVQSAVKAYQNEIGRLWEQGAETTAQTSEVLGKAVGQSADTPQPD